eukprot:TRINITY_DN5592_c0_g1_i1.p1 TRINITY_DN5592_c0_g1~~TRINITY_DN5592_c0_g1_i1.p1  ORF type:complete len:311 (+),score=96.76 TRINITY_DN5592_c0_g1_i1:24-956(+)
MSKAKKGSSAAAVKIAKDLKESRLNPVEGIYCELIDEADMFNWRIWFQGPGDTPFEGGLFCARMEFPEDYPMSPPKLMIESEFWHPNVYQKNGVVCISILHPPGNDEVSGEKAEERWSPAQTVSTIMLSFLSLLSDPNFSSPANVDANVDMKDNYSLYKEKVKRLVDKSKQLAPPEIWGLIPHPDTDPVQMQEQRDRIFKELQPQDDNLDWMNYGDLESDNELGDFDFEDYDANDEEYEEDKEEDKEEEDKGEEDKEEEGTGKNTESCEDREDDSGKVGEATIPNKKRKRQESDEESAVPVTTKKQKGQI